MRSDRRGTSRLVNSTESLAEKCDDSGQVKLGMKMRSAEAVSYRVDHPCDLLPS